MCTNGPLIIVAFGPLFGLWPSSFFVSSRDRGPRHFMLQNWSKTSKNEVPPKYMCKGRPPIIGPRLGWLVILILNSCHYQS